jgi:hypothetical protein
LSEMRTPNYAVLLSFLTLFGGAVRAEDFAIPLAKGVLYETNRVVSAQAGMMTSHPPEILAFNVLYKSAHPGDAFKEVFKKGRTAGKFYALIGLYLLKDREFDALRKEFLNSPQEPVYCQYGCKASDANDAKHTLQTWLEGIPKGLWYTKIVITPDAN